MNFDQFNEKSKLLINEAQNKAISLNHQQILPLHLFYSILNDNDDLVLDLFKELKIDIMISKKSYLVILIFLHLLQAKI
jgi:ATP-dependent Clp protease ATP-binding subunit ClpB